MIAIITGASSGLGKDFSYLLSEKGYDLVVVARSKDKLLQLKDDLESKYHNNIDVISLDLSKNQDKLIDYTKNMDIDLLINNAGFGGFGEFIEADYDKLDQMIDLNIKALMKLSYYYANVMKNKKNGKILNVSSIAAFQPGPYMAVYYATKSFVLSLSESMDYELKKYNVRVSALCPGPTKTEFFTNAGANQSKIFSVTKPMKSMDVVRYAYKMMMKSKRIIIPGIKYRLLIFFEKLIPRSLTLKIIGKVQSKRKEENKKG